MIEQVASFRISQPDADTGHSVVEGVNLETLVLPLLLMKPVLFNAISSMLMGGQMTLSKTEAQFPVQEFEELLASSHEASADALRKTTRTFGCANKRTNSIERQSSHLRYPRAPSSSLFGRTQYKTIETDGKL